jgi:DNA (cytosine-5)-methyltransferase 1
MKVLRNNKKRGTFMYSVVDLFAGAGGLSLGFLQTNWFDIKVAFENNPDMQATYKKNHPGVEVLGDVCSANYQDIMNKYGDIDVVIGGPPCQGFSNANRQKNHAINMNNMLVKQYIRAIVELQPKAFVLENVSMLRSDTHRFFMDKKDKNIFTLVQACAKLLKYMITRTNNLTMFVELFLLTELNKTY